MPRLIKRILWLVIFGAAIGVAMWYASRPKPIPVVLKDIERGRVEATVANTRAGTVDACHRARLSPPMGGQIAKLLVREGEDVAVGQLLLELWNDDIAAQLTLSIKEAAAAGARAEEACVAADVAEREANRVTRLRKQGLASDEVADRAEGEAKTKHAACKAATISTGVAEAQVNVNRAALERTRLRSPLDGTVAKINGKLGEFVTPSPVGVPTPPAVDIVDTSCLYVTAPIDEVDAPAIRAGMPARIVLDAFPGRDFPAKVRRVAPYVLDVEQQARTVDIEVDFIYPDDVKVLLPGYSADAEVVLDAKDDVLRVPTEAVLEGKHVLVYQSGGRTLEERQIETGLSNWVFTEVLSGLDAGERVVTSVDREGIKPGALVVPE